MHAKRALIAFLSTTWKAPGTRPYVVQHRVTGAHGPGVLAPLPRDIEISISSSSSLDRCVRDLSSRRAHAYSGRFDGGNEQEPVWKNMDLYSGFHPC